MSDKEKDNHKKQAGTRNTKGARNEVGAGKETGVRKQPVEKKMSWKKKILIELLLGLISAIAIVVLLYFCGKIMPHNKNFTYVSEYLGYTYDDRIGDKDFKYHYVATAFQGRCYIDSDEDLSEKIVNEECDLTIKILGLRWYKTDNSGIFMKYPVIVYENIPIEDDDDR